MLLGKTSFYKQIVVDNPLEARLSLAGLYILALMPVMMIYFRVGVEILNGLLILLFFFRSYRCNRWEWMRMPPVVIALALWLFTLLVVTPNAQNYDLSYARNDWWRFIFLFAAIAYWLSDYHEEMKRIAAFIVIILVLAGIDGLIQYYTGFSLRGMPYEKERLTGPFSKVVLGIFTAKFSIPCFGILYYYAWRNDNRRLLYLLTAIAIYLFFVLLCSNERTAMLSTLIALGLIALGFFIHFRKFRIHAVAGVVSIMLMVLGFYHTQPSMQRRLAVTQESIKNLSTNEYLGLWNASIVMFRSHPFTGVGMANFRSECPALASEGHLQYCSSHSHNIYFEFLAETGMIGFLGLTMLVASLFMEVIRNHDTEDDKRFVLTIAALAGILLSFFPFLPTQSFFSNWPAFLLWQSVAWSLAIVRGGRKIKAVDCDD